MLQFFALKRTSFKPLQSLKAYLLIEVTEFGISTDDKCQQLQNADSPIDVTEFPILTDAKPKQSLNAMLPIEVTELGITTDVNR